MRFVLWCNGGYYAGETLDRHDVVVVRTVDDVAEAVVFTLAISGQVAVVGSPLPPGEWIPFLCGLHRDKTEGAHP